MSTSLTEAKVQPGSKAVGITILIGAAMIAFSACFVAVDYAYYNFANAHFPSVGDSTWLANLWGVFSRAYLIIPLIPLVIWRRRWLGFQVGKIREHWKMVLIMLVANCAVIGAYLWLTSGGTPYSGNQWLITETITVPLVEETFWRGLVLAMLLTILGRYHGENSSSHLAVWFSGVAFGLLHMNNVLSGVPIQFAAIQSLSAVIWGVMYGYARVKTQSIYPPLLFHAAMNLVVVLF